MSADLHLRQVIPLSSTNMPATIARHAMDRALEINAFFWILVQAPQRCLRAAALEIAMPRAHPMNRTLYALMNHTPYAPSAPTHTSALRISKAKVSRFGATAPAWEVALTLRWWWR